MVRFSEDVIQLAIEMHIPLQHLFITLHPPAVGARETQSPLTPFNQTPESIRQREYTRWLRARLIVQVKEVVDGSMFTALWHGEVIKCRAFPNTSSLSVGSMVVVTRLENATEYFSRHFVTRSCAVYAEDTNYNPTALVTSSIASAAPVWSEVRGGLPIYADGPPVGELHMQIPANPNIAYVMTKNDVGGGVYNWALYKHTNLFGDIPGNWTNIYDWENFFVDIGYPDAIDYINDWNWDYIDAMFDVSPADPNHISIMVGWRTVIDGVNEYHGITYIHSHTAGATWEPPIHIKGNKPYGDDPHDYYVPYGRHRMRAGLTDASRIYAYVEWRDYAPDPDETNLVLHSHDGGHTWAWTINDQGGFNVGYAIELERINNSADDRLMLFGSDDSYSIDGSHSFATVTSEPGGSDPQHFALDLENFMANADVDYVADFRTGAWALDPTIAALLSPYAVGLRNSDQIVVFGKTFGPTVPKVLYGEIGDWVDATGNLEGVFVFTTVGPTQKINEVIVI